MTIQCCAVLLLPVALLVLAGSSPVVAQLELGYYSKTCPNVEAIVRKEMEKIISAAPSLAGPLLRLHFHDCFVRVSILFLTEASNYDNVELFFNFY
jgi:peroxidase